MMKRRAENGRQLTPLREIYPPTFDRKPAGRRLI